MGGQGNSRGSRGSEGENDETHQSQASSDNFHQQRVLSRASSVTARERPTVYLHSAIWPFVIFLAYAAVCLYPWVVFCITATKPIGSKKEYSNIEWESKTINSSIAKHERHIRAAEILMSVATLLTIPVTSAICSMAAVAFMQRGSLRTKMNLIQLGALVDQGWASPKVLIQLSKVGSKPLYVAFAMTVVGM